MENRNASGKRFDKKGAKPANSSAKKSYKNNTESKNAYKSKTSDNSEMGKKPYNRGKSVSENKSYATRKTAEDVGKGKFEGAKRPFSKGTTNKEDRFIDNNKKSFTKGKTAGDNKFNSTRKPSGRDITDKFEASKKPYNRTKIKKDDGFGDREKSFTNDRTSRDNKYGATRKPSGRDNADRFETDKKPYSRSKNIAEDKFASSTRKPSLKGTAAAFDKNKKPYTKERSGEKGKYPSKKGAAFNARDEREEEIPKRLPKPENIANKESFRKKGISEDAKPLKGNTTKQKSKFEFRSVRKAKLADEKNTRVNKKTAEQDLNTGEIRLNRFIANAGICSRREADTLITAGLVTINGSVVVEMGYKVKAGDDIRYNGERLSVEEKIYILMNKPKDAITTAEDPEGRKTVFDLIEGKLAQRVFAVGRLDRNTTGVLLLTNDGDLAQRLMHPKYEVEKVYIATLNKDLTKNDLWQLAGGVELEDGPIKPDAVAYAEESKKDVIGVEIHSGRNRIIHRMFEHMGYLVDKLDRVAYAGLTKAKLKRGEWRELTEKELKTLKRNVKIS